MSLSNNFPTVSPTLNLNFAAAGRLDSRVTFTRSSTATYVNQIGLIQSAAVNEPRFDYNPSTLAARGLLIEESRTNLLTYSEQFDDAAWTKYAATITANSIQSPSGETTADSFVENTSTDFHGIVSGLISTAAGYAFSVFVKKGSRQFVNIKSTATISQFAAANFNLDNDTYTTAIGAGGGFSSVSASIQTLSNGWKRISLIFTAPSTFDVAIQASNSATPTYGNYGNIEITGTGDASYYFWGAQLEAGSFATSYIPTVASSVTRSADVASVNTLSPWYNNTEMTIYWEAAGYANGAYEVFDLDAGSNSGRIRTRFSSAFQADRLNAVGDGVFELDGGSVSANVFYKMAVGMTSGSQALSLNGGAVVTASGSFSGLTTPTTARIGSNWVPGEFLNGWIKRIAYYPRKLTNAELIALTA